MDGAPVAACPVEPALARRFLARLLGLVALLSLASVALCWLIDPYAIYGRGPELKSGSVVMRHPRMFKAHDAFRRAPSDLLVGTSRVEQGLDPFHPVFGGRQSRAYNLAVPAGSLYEMLRHIQHATAAGRLERVYLELCFFQFNAHIPLCTSDFKESRLAVDAEGRPQPWHAWADVVDTLWSLEAQGATWKTLNLLSPRRRVPGGPDGIYPGGRNNPLELRVFRDRRPRFSFDLNAQQFVSRNGPFFYGGMAFADAQGRWPPMEHLRRIVEHCRSHGLALTLFFSPEHARQTWSAEACGQWSLYERMKREVVALAASDPDRPIPVWDFSRANAWTAEAIPPAAQMERSMRWYNDGGHYTLALGDLLLAAMVAGNGPAGFGERLEAASLDASLAAQRADLMAWAGSHPFEVAEVERLRQGPAGEP